jgi:hypothetical protein
MDYRRKAEECRMRADLAALPEQRAGWTRLAQDWETFADSMEEIARQWNQESAIRAQESDLKPCPSI